VSTIASSGGKTSGSGLLTGQVTLCQSFQERDESLPRPGFPQSEKKVMIITLSSARLPHSLTRSIDRSINESSGRASEPPLSCVTGHDHAHTHIHTLGHEEVGSKRIASNDPRPHTYYHCTKQAKILFGLHFFLSLGVLDKMRQIDTICCVPKAARKGESVQKLEYDAKLESAGSCADC